MKTPAQTELEKKRADWWARHFRPGMPYAAVLRLIEQSNKLYPATPEEREQKRRSLERMPEFVL